MFMHLGNCISTPRAGSLKRASISICINSERRVRGTQKKGFFCSRKPRRERERERESKNEKKERDQQRTPFNGDSRR